MDEKNELISEDDAIKLALEHGATTEHEIELFLAGFSNGSNKAFEKAMENVAGMRGEITEMVTSAFNEGVAAGIAKCINIETDKSYQKGYEAGKRDASTPF